MPLGVKHECVRCGTRETPLWHATDAGSLCNTCLEDERNVDGETTVKNEDEEKNCLGSRPSRKSTRTTRYCKPRPNSTIKTAPKGKGRRHIFKKQVFFLIFFLLIYNKLVIKKKFLYIFFFLLKYKINL